VTWRELLGKVVTEGVPVAIGVSVGTAQLGGGDDEDKGMAEDGSRRQTSWWGELVLAAGGAVLLAANVAPTEEVLLIAVETAAWKVLLLVVLALALAAVILYYSDFTGAESAAAAGGVARGATGVLAVYTIALVSSAFILWFFGRFAGAAPALCVAQTAVLAVPASLGAAGGRLLLR
jgi:putative integral membrane protein (TIGR02587 family)